MTASLQACGVRWRRVASGEWGAVVEDVGGGVLELGLRVREGLLCVQAWAAPAGALDPQVLLHRNRLGTLARYAHSSAGEVHVHAEAFTEGLTPGALDRLLGAVVEAVEVARAGWRAGGGGGADGGGASAAASGSGGGGGAGSDGRGAGAGASGSGGGGGAGSDGGGAGAGASRSGGGGGAGSDDGGAGAGASRSGAGGATRVVRDH